MSPPRPTELAHHLLSTILREGDHAIDATCGNGHDTLFLAKLVGTHGKVSAYDIQSTAIRATESATQLAALDASITCHLKSHARMAEDHSDDSIRAILFNLGYLPGQTHDITTVGHETLLALNAAKRLIMPGGALSIICYPGHPEGANEAVIVESWITTLPSEGWRVAKYAMLGTQKPAPFLLFCCKGG